MHALDWQQSSYCAEGNACLSIAKAPDGTVRLRESDEPAVIATTTPNALRAFIRSVRTGDLSCTSRPQTHA